MNQIRLLLITFVFLLISIAMSAQQPGTCDPATGLCVPYPVEETAVKAQPVDHSKEIIYVGDPMCSWCWGISPQLNKLQHEAEQSGIGYRIVVGGLRPGGGDEWNEKFKDFLKHHWEEVNQRSGQPFGNTLFDLAQFDYDTEPSCRAVVAARRLDPEIESRFFEWTQHHFYVQNEDPKNVEFYRPICKELNLDFDKFAQLFQSDEIKQATQAEFNLNRQWGVRGYPTVIFRDGDKMYAIARGFSTFDQMWDSVQQLAEEN